MGRQSRSGQGRQSTNSSFVTVTNNSILDDGDVLEYSDFIKTKFGGTDLENASGVKIVGYASTISTIGERIEELLSSNSYRRNFSLISGPSETGKTTIVHKVAERYLPKLSYFYLEASWILEKEFGVPRLRMLFDEASKKAPSLIFIDNIESICTEKRTQSETKDRILLTLRKKLESLYQTRDRVLVFAATDWPEVVEMQLRKPRFLRHKIRFGLPNRQDRMDILKHLIEQVDDNLTEDQLKRIAEASHCYSYPDLEELCNIAIQNSKGGKLNYESLKRALSLYKPETIKSVTTPCQPLRWSDIGGVESVKEKLQRSVIWPLEHREKFQRLKGSLVSKKGVLLYGPPGCSKTMLAQALANESGYNFISVKGPELFSKYVGDSEAALRKLYRNAREIAPCLIFFDEIDGMASERNDNQSSSVGEKMVSQLLVELNGVDPLENVFTIAATNRPDRLDSALMRPGRLRPAIYISLPDQKDRRAIFAVHMRHMALKFEKSESMDTFLDELAHLTEGYSGAEIAEVCTIACDMTVLESVDNEHVEWRHFLQALDEVRPETPVERLRTYELFQERSLQYGKKEPPALPSRSTLLRLSTRFSRILRHR